MFVQAIHIRKGAILNYNNDLWRVIDREHHTPGNLRAIIRLTMKSIANGTKIEERFRPGDTVDKASLDVASIQFLYRQGDRYCFMNNDNYEQIELDEETIGEARFYITEGRTVSALMHGENIVGIDLPPKVELTVVETTPYLKGATASNSPKPATMETGLVVTIPNFISEGEKVRIDTETGQYVERVK
jgi:elongation factor P